MTETKTENPLDDVFVPIPLGDFNQSVEDAKIPPLETATYKFEVIEFIGIIKSQKSDDRYAKYKIQIIDDENDDNNGRKTNISKMIEGPGVGFMERFMKACNHFPGKEGVTKKFLSEFVGCKFKAAGRAAPELEADKRTPKKDPETGKLVLSSFYNVDNEEPVR